MKEKVAIYIHIFIYMYKIFYSFVTILFVHWDPIVYKKKKVVLQVKKRTLQYKINIHYSLAFAFALALAFRDWIIWQTIRVLPVVPPHSSEAAAAATAGAITWAGSTAAGGGGGGGGGAAGAAATCCISTVYVCVAAGAGA